MELPADIRLEISGASDQLSATREALFSNFIVAILIAYLLMVAVFSHWGYPLLIMTNLPVGISGGIAGLYLINLAGANLDQLGLNPINQPFDMITMLGFLVLIGTVVNNPILIVELTASNLKKKGMNIVEAVTEAVRIRLRPILMSDSHHGGRFITTGIQPWGRHRALPGTRRHRTVWTALLHDRDFDLYAGSAGVGIQGVRQTVFKTTKTSA